MIDLKVECFNKAFLEWMNLIDYLVQYIFLQICGLTIFYCVCLVLEPHSRRAANQGTNEGGPTVPRQVCQSRAPITQLHQVEESRLFAQEGAS